MKKNISTIFLLILSLSVGVSAQSSAPEAQTAALIETSANEKAAADKETAMTIVAKAETADEKKAEAAVKPAPQATPYVRPTSKERFNRFASDSFGVPALISSGISSTFNQISNNPSEWNRTTEGFARRFASNYGKGAIRGTVSYGLSEAFKLDNRFEKSGKKNIGARLKHVFLASYTTRTKSGGRIPDFPYAVGTYAASITATEVWFPDRYSYKDGLRQGTISLGTRFGVNLLREFFFPK